MIALLLLACTRGPRLPAGDPERPDVILISVDTLRADHLGVSGYDRNTTPGLDALAAGGTRFASAWSAAPWTLPSHGTLLSGLLPLHHGGIEGNRSLDPTTVWLPQAMQSAGYRTIGVVSSLFVSQRYGFDRGFDSFDDFGIKDEKENLTVGPRADAVVDRAIAATAEATAGQPVFLFVHLYDVHYPYAPPAPWDEKFDRAAGPGDLKYRNYAWYVDHPVDPEQMDHQVAQYDEEIAWTDDQIARLLGMWSRSARPAVVMVVSDHGEEFGERGSWGHAHTLFPEQLHIPWLASGPGITAQVVDARVGIEDVAPTIASLAGVSLPGPTDGVDRAPALRGDPIGGTAVAARYAETSRFRTLRMRWHDPPNDLYVDLEKGRLVLCDLSTDSTCRRDAALDHPDTALAMEQVMYEWLGMPFVARDAGVAESKGVFVVYGQRAARRVVLQPGTRFALFPADASFTFSAPEGATEGPWQVVGGALPGPDAAIRYEGPVPGSVDVELTEEQRRELEAIGYVQ